MRNGGNHAVRGRPSKAGDRLAGDEFGSVNLRPVAHWRISVLRFLLLLILMRSAGGNAAPHHHHTLHMRPLTARQDRSLSWYRLSGRNGVLRSRLDRVDHSGCPAGHWCDYSAPRRESRRDEIFGKDSVSPLPLSPGISLAACVMIALAPVAY